MFTLISSYEKAKFADIQRRVEQEQKIMDYREDDFFYSVADPRPHNKFWYALLGMLAMFIGLLFV